jgi:hypothetical protein
MIKYDLKCGEGHVFEAWFRDSAAYEALAAAGEVACPDCGDRSVTKRPMAPAVARADRTAARRRAVLAAALRELHSVRDHVERTCDYVGDRFPEEARRMHYGEAERHNIYGEASEAEAEALADEGIEVGRVPWLPRPD